MRGKTTCAYLSGLVLLVAAAPAVAAAGCTPSDQRVDRAFLAMYDLDFTGAEREIKGFEAAHPVDPMGPVTEAASLLFSMFEKHQVLQAEFFTSDRRYTERKPITPDKVSADRFASALDRGERLATQVFARDPGNTDALFAFALVYGLRADYAALIERRDFAALRYSNRASESARKLLAIAPDCYDAYLAIGVQKYLVSLRPAPMRWLLRLGGVSGDQEKAVQELSLAAQKGHYLAPFARILLAVAYLRKNEPQPALRLLSQLHDQFPHNSLFANEVARLQGD